MMFNATQRDLDDLERLKREITANRDRHGTYKIECFNTLEAEWIKARLLEWRPDLTDRLWMTFIFRVAA